MKPLSVKVQALGRRSLASFLRLALRVVLILLYIAIPFAVLGCAVAVLASYGVEIDPPWIDLPPPAPSPILAWLFTTAVAISLFVSIVVVDRLRRIFATLAAGDPFVPENATHLRIIAAALAAGELARYALGAGVVAVTMAMGIEPSEEFRREPMNLPFFIWFAVLTVIVLAEVFREGARLRQEQQLTI